VGRDAVESSQGKPKGAKASPSFHKFREKATSQAGHETGEWKGLERSALYLLVKGEKIERNQDEEG